MNEMVERIAKIIYDNDSTISISNSVALAKAIIEAIQADNKINKIISKEKWCKLKASDSVFNVLTK